MNLGKTCALLGITLSGWSGLTAGQSAINIRYDKTLDFSGQQATGLAEDVLNNNRDRFVNYTTTSGNWRTQSASTWTSGYVPGIFWYLYALEENATWKDYAMHWAEGVRPRATATDNDTGLQVYPAFGLGVMFNDADPADYMSVMNTGALTMVTERYNPTIACFRSWDQNTSNPTDLPFEVNIDQMMNMELVLWSGQNGGPSEYVDYAVNHADQTWENNVREDGSTYHVVAYNLDGTVDYKRTHQGWNTDSTWSRGQAWAVYGYAMFYNYTGLPRMLERSKKCYEYWMAETLKDSWDYVPYSDFDAALDSENPRDTSAAAIVACGALQLYEITGDKMYLADAEAILESLSSPRYLSIRANYDSILLKGSEKWGKGEVGAVFGDYYFMEALWRWSQIEQAPAEVTGSWAGYEVYDDRFIDATSWIGWMDSQATPYVYNYLFEAWFYSPPEDISDVGGWVYSWR